MTREQKEVNAEWLRNMIMITDTWLWKDEGELYEIEDGKFVPQTINGRIKLMGILTTRDFNELVK